MTTDERLARLERSAWRWRTATFALLAVVVCGVLAAAAPGEGEPRVLKVKGVQVVNDAGDVVVALVATRDGRGQMHVVAPKARGSGFTAASDGFALTGSDGAGVAVTSNAKGTALIVSGKGDKSAVMLYPDAQGVGHISLLRADGTTVAWEAPPK